MTQIDLQIGHKIRTKRRKLGITQVDLSKKLSISPSYLNLIESGKRKVNVDLLLKLANELNIEISDISKKTDTNLYQNLMDLLGDNLFEDLDITNFDIKELVNTNPLIAKALVKLGDNYKKKNQDIVSKVENISGKFIDNRKNSFPGEVVSDFIQENENYFPKLEGFASNFYNNIQIKNRVGYSSICEYLRSKHGIEVKEKRAQNHQHHFIMIYRILMLMELSVFFGCHWNLLTKTKELLGSRVHIYGIKFF